MTLSIGTVFDKERQDLITRLSSELKFQIRTEDGIIKSASKDHFV
jgi:hypothetical protein